MSIQVNLKDIIEEVESSLRSRVHHSILKLVKFMLVTSEDLGAAEEGKPFEHLLEWQQ